MTEIDSPTAPEPRVLHDGVSRVGALRRLAFLGVPRLVDTWLPSLPPLSRGVFLPRVSVSKFPSPYQDTSHWIKSPPYSSITSS